jgi:hypothetical protein
LRKCLENRGEGANRYKIEPVSPAASVYHSILRLTPLSSGEKGGKQYGAWAREYSLKTLRGVINRHVKFSEHV